MKLAVTGARILLGLIFVVFGLNYFLGFLGQPELNEELGGFIGALAGTGYMMPLIKITEIVAGLMIMSGRMTPLGLILLAPVSVNILLAHIFLDAAGLPMALVIIALQLFLAWAYRDSFDGVLHARAEPLI